MQIITMLLIVVSILTLLSGTAIFFGSTKTERPRSFWFFMATIFATIWSIAISMFIAATPSWQIDLNLVVILTFISAIFIDIALLGFINWRQKFGKIITVAFLIGGIVLSVVFSRDHTLLYTDINLAASGNSITTNIGPFYFVYIAFFCLLVPTVILSLLRKIIKSTSKRLRSADLVLLIGFMISGTVSLIFNLILPLWTWNLIWLGPLAISSTIIGFYYAVLRYHVISLSSRWLKIFSFIVIITSSAVVYMAIFYLIFIAIFRGSSPSTEVIVLNFIMILIVATLMPAMTELSSFIGSLISGQQIDMGYVIKKITKTRMLDTKELAEFLAEHMHFEYVGILLDGQLYNSSPRHISKESIKMLDSLGEPEQGIWQKIDTHSEAWRDLDASAVAVLRDSSGKVYGQIIIGKPTGKVSYSHRDHVEVETIINIAAITIDSRRRKKK